MNTPDQGKKPKKKRGHVISLSDAVEMQKEQKAKESRGREVDASREIYQAKINKLLIEWYQSTMFPILIRKDWVCAALCHVSDLSLKTTFDMFSEVAVKAINAIETVEYTYQEMDLVLQAFANVNAHPLGCGLEEYMYFKREISAIAQEFDKTFNENKDRILAENPYKETNMPESFTFDDESKNEWVNPEDIAVNTVGEA
jgi:hypothetical protein